MDLQTRISQLSQAIGSDIKTLIDQLEQLEQAVNAVQADNVVWSDTAGERPDPATFPFGKIFINVDDGVLCFTKSDGTLATLTSA